MNRWGKLLNRAWLCCCLVLSQMPQVAIASDGDSMKKATVEFGYGALGEILGALGLGYAAFSALDKGTPGGASERNIVYVVGPAVLLGGVYGSAAGVSLGGLEVGDSGSFWGASNGAWLGAIAALGIAYGANVTFNGGIKDQPLMLAAALSLPPIGAIWGYRKRFGTHSQIAYEAVLYAEQSPKPAFAPGLRLAW